MPQKSFITKPLTAINSAKCDMANNSLMMKKWSYPLSLKEKINLPCKENTVGQDVPSAYFFSRWDYFKLYADIVSYKMSVKIGIVLFAKMESRNFRVF